MPTEHNDAKLSRVAEQTELDPVTFEVLRNSFSTIVDQMAEQVLRTCYSFVIYVRDFSSALCDRNGNTVAQGSQDIAVHVGTLHLTAKAVLDMFGDEMAPGDVYVMNDPYLGGTHQNDVRFIRPVFYEGELIAMAQCNGHWSDVGGSVPGSLDMSSTEYYQGGLRITPMKVWDKGVLRKDVVHHIVSNTRSPVEAEGDLHAQAEATKVAEAEILRLVEKYGKDTVLQAMEESQTYVERIVRSRVAELPDGEWETVDFVDFDPAAEEEDLVPVKVKLKIDGDQIYYDLSGSAPAMASALNCAFGMSFSGLVVPTKMFFPDVPLNSGFYRTIDVELGPPGSLVNAPAPVAVGGFNAGVYEKIVAATFELWSQIMPERAMACQYNIEYLVVGGRDVRFGDKDRRYMRYDWTDGGWGARNGKDGFSATAPIFGVGLQNQPLEGQERLAPIFTSWYEFVTDSGGPGRFRGGLGVLKGGVMRGAEDSVLSYASDRSRNVAWGIEGGLPSIPIGVWLEPNSENPRFIGSWFANQPMPRDSEFQRPSGGGGGYGDPLTRDPERVLADVEDGYVSVERARKDYGVVLHVVNAELDEYEVDLEATIEERKKIAAQRVEWLRHDPEEVAEMYRRKEIDEMDAVRRYGVILDWGTGELLANTTRTYREMYEKRAIPSWEQTTPEQFAGSKPR